MTIVFDTLTGMTKRFCKRLGYPMIDINEYNDNPVEGDIILVTRSIHFGQVTEVATEFMQQHYHQVVGLAVSGNRNWGEAYGAAGEKLSRAFNIPLICKFEGSGFPNDVRLVQEYIEERVKK